MKYIRVYPSLE